jgi:formylglycine-generating enzyme required for sulfatase activity
MGAQDPRTALENGHDATADARPIHRVYVDGFWMDKTDVTNEQFAAFVRATDYVTVAEHKPRIEDFPGVEIGQQHFIVRMLGWRSSFHGPSHSAPFIVSISCSVPTGVDSIAVSVKRDVSP